MHPDVARNRALANFSKLKAAKPDEGKTRRLLIDLVLHWVGYNAWDLAAHHRQEIEHPVPGGGKTGGNGRLDYLLLRDGKPYAGVETKALGVELDRRRVKQLLDYCHYSNLRWGVLTNGHEWRLYDRERDGDQNARLVHKWRFDKADSEFSLLIGPHHAAALEQLSADIRGADDATRRSRIAEAIRQVAAPAAWSARQAYCIKCKQTRTMTGAREETTAGRARLKGKCAVCSTPISRFLKANHA